MQNAVLVGKKKALDTIPFAELRRNLEQARPRIAARLDFMTPDHHAVRYFAVRELPSQRGKPLSPAGIAQGTGLPLARVKKILAELEKRLFFLVRDKAGAVAWAFPVTRDRTPHRLLFSSGERSFAA